MAENSKIEWCHHTANLWWGCTEVHAGCDNCYARVLSHRWGHELWGNDAPRKIIKNTFLDLARYQKDAAAAGEMHRVFVGSMMDIFEKPMPAINHKHEPIPQIKTDFYRNLLFKQISDGEYPNLIFLFLTKRPSNINKMIPETWKENPPSNVMFGTSPVDQKTADTLIPQLMGVNGNRFLSIEPMLGPVDIFSSMRKYQIQRYYPSFDDWFKKWIHWIIVGGESGAHKRQFNSNWARSIQDQCTKASIPFFMKQIDKVKPIPDDLMIREFPNLQPVKQ